MAFGGGADPVAQLLGPQDRPAAAWFDRPAGALRSQILSEPPPSRTSDVSTEPESSTAIAVEPCGNDRRP